VQKRLIPTSGLKSGIAIMFLDRSFLYDVRILAIHGHLRHKLAYVCLQGFSRPFGPKWQFFGTKGEGLVRC